MYNIKAQNLEDNKAGLGANSFYAGQEISGANFAAGTPNLTLTALTGQNQYSRPALAFICDGQNVYGSIWMDADGVLKYNQVERVYRIHMTTLS